MIVSMNAGDSERESKRLKIDLTATSTNVSSASAPRTECASSSKDVDDILRRGCFSDNFRPTKAVFPPGFRQVVPPSDLLGFNSDIARTFRCPPVAASHLSTNIDKYWDLMKSRSISLQKAGGAVCAAYETAYGDQIALFSSFLAAAINDGQIPYQPQTTRERVLALIHEKTQDNRIRLSQFMQMLPGFESVCEEDRQILLLEKHLIGVLLHHTRYFRKGECYYVSGPEEVHVGTYWMEVMGLDPEFIRFWLKCGLVFNDIGLTLTECYLLLAAAFFDPGATAASDKLLLGSLHAFYLDSLFYLIGHRLQGAERMSTYTRLEQAMKIFPVLSDISVKQFRSLDAGSVPFVSTSREST
ncbi:uncharacterized protein LOC129596200 isoform X2 [Paramacrobiotus metropolitanus]|uniref:uncharacterized protein LOC129596200 isoform X2 n=2 Tax=Paramacrobiotus metropolitanus TaxID=2943436 RepID=UPI002445F37D|nr:uncharacterized protein LOC129596200 isoform X2 [Paramacrobiotus metropolitanus]